MTYTGIDTAARISAAQAKILLDNGVSFVGRYLVPPEYSKSITAQEIKALRENGLAILLCWEIGAEAMKRGATQGAADGAKARKLAEEFRVPSGTTIYFAADYNVPTADLLQCEQYIRAAQAALGRYEAGIYGGESVVSFLKSRGVRRVWQCVAWTNKFLETANVRQYAWQGAAESKAMAAKVGVAVDMNATEDMCGAGLWMPWNQYEDGDSVIIEPIKVEKPKKMWYDDAMEWMKSEGLMQDGRPNDPVTRAELAMVFYRKFGPTDEKENSGLISE